jgi:hypothetical protein
MADAANTAAIRNGGGYARHHLVQIVAAAAARSRVDLGVVLSSGNSAKGPFAASPLQAALLCGAFAKLDIASHSAGNLQSFSKGFILRLLSPSSRGAEDVMRSCGHKQASRRFDSDPPYICAGRQRRALGQPIVWISKA